MSVVNMDAILDKVYAWEKSEKGQKKIRKTINRYVSKNKTRTEAGSRVITESDINKAAKTLVDTVRNTATSCNLPASVAAHFDSLRAGKARRQEDGSYTVEISFSDDLSRESLDPSKYGGVRNIVAIFNNGYPSNEGRVEAISNVTGFWHGEYISALGRRQGLYFMQDAVNDFNLNYGLALGMYAELSAIYDGE